MERLLFGDVASPASVPRGVLGEGAAFLAGFALGVQDELLASLPKIAEQSPFHNMTTPGGFRMSVAMTNCGRLGWVTDRTGYRYDPADPDTGAPWPAMPEAFFNLAVRAAAEAGFARYDPDACLI